MLKKRYYCRIELYSLNKKYLNIIIYALSVNILLASIGLPLHKRSCEMPGMKDVFKLFTPPSKCFEDFSKTSHKKANHCAHQHSKKSEPIDPCCDFSVDLLAVEYVSLELSDKFTALDMEWITDQTPIWDTFISCKYILEKQIILFSDSSPPFSGKQIITLKQSFLI